MAFRSLLLALPVALILFFVGREKDEDEHVPGEDGPQSGKLSRHFWISWFGFVACISSEFATSFWAAALLKDRVGSTAAISTVAIVALGTGMGLGRWYGGLVLGHLKLDTQLPQSDCIAICWLCWLLVITQHDSFPLLPICSWNGNLNAVCTLFNSFNRIK